VKNNNNNRNTITVSQQLWPSDPIFLENN